MFDFILERAIEKAGSQKALACELEISPPEITRFRTGEIGIKIKTLNKLFKVSGLEVTSEKERNDLISAALTFADLYKRRQKKGA